MSTESTQDESEPEPPGGEGAGDPTPSDVPTVVPSTNIVANLDRAALARLVETDPGAVVGLLDNVDKRRHEFNLKLAEQAMSRK